MLTVSPCSTPVSTRTAQRQIPHKQKKKGVGNLNKLYKAIAMLQAGKKKDWLFQQQNCGLKHLLHYLSSIDM